MRKKILGLLGFICAILLFASGLFSSEAFAQSPVSIGLSLDKSGVIHPGDTVTATVTFNPNHQSIGALTLRLGYDGDVFDVKNEFNQYSPKGAMMTSCDVATTGQNRITYSTVGTGLLTFEQTTMFTATFTVKESVSAQSTELKLYLESADISDGESQPITPPESITQSLTITIPATGITISPETLELAVGETDTLTATLEPTGAEGNITWSSNYLEVATVDASTGQVTVNALSVGKATITATCGEFKDTCEVTVNPAPISGAVTISGTPTFGKTLTANVTGITPALAQDSLAYQWYRGDIAISDATENSYTLTADDIGKTIKVAVTGTGNYSGTKTSEATSAVVKANQSTPTLNTAEVTDTSVTLTTIPGAQYAKSETDEHTSVTWQDAPNFTGLDENKTYYFFAKLAATDTHNESPVASIQVTTKKTLRNVTVKIDPETTTTENKAECTYDQDNFGVGSRVNLTATPGNDYTFTDWSATYGENQLVAITNASSTTASFIMPAADVTVTAAFAKKDGAPGAWTYPKGNSPSFDADLKVEDLFSFTGKTDETTPVVAITYEKDGQSVEGTAEATAGSYVATYTYTSSSGSTYATTVKLSGSVTVTSATQAAPGAITGGEVTTNSITISTVEGQAYIIREGVFDSKVNAADFTEGAESEDGTKTFSNLNPGTQYTVYTIKPAVEGKYQASAIVSATYTTKNTFSWTVTPDGDITFFARTGATELPAAKTYTITNTGTGALTELSVDLNTGTNFTVTGSGKTSLEKGESTTFTIQPKTGTSMDSEATYTDSLTISAKKGTSGDGDGNGVNMEDVVRKVQFDVVDKHVVTISGLDTAYTFTYNGKPQGIPPEGITGTSESTEESKPFDGQLDIWYEGASYSKSKTAPTAAGSYTVTVQVPDNDPDYMGQDTASLTIAPKPLTVTGLTAQTRVYDGTKDVTLIGGVLDGVIAGDDVSATMPQTGTYDSADAGSGKAVNITAIDLTGEDAANYSLTQPDVTGEITKRPVEITITCADKEYDGTTDATVSTWKFEAENGDSGIIEADKDNITVTVSSATFADKNAGEGKQVTIGTVTTSGDAAKNYTFTNNSTATANITPRKVTVTISGSDTATYTGAVQKPHTATYTPVADDTADATVNYDPDNPVKAGTYTLTATINDPNYQQDGELEGTTTFTINKGGLTHQDVTINAKQETTNTVNVSQFNIAAPAGSLAPNGTYMLGTVTGDDAILDGEPTLENGVITFTMAANAEVGKKASIPVIYTPEEGTYEKVTANIIITASELGFTTSLTGMPQSVKLGEDLDLTNAKLVVTFDEDAGLADLTIPVTAGMITGYDKDGTGAASIGNKTLMVTYGDTESGRTYTATGTIQVQDVVTGIAFGTAPTDAQKQYTWSKDKAFKLEDVTIRPTMKSQVSAEPVSVTADMLNPDASILDQLGEHTITVTYEGQTVTFKIQVTQPKIEGITQPPAAGEAGVTDVGDDTTFEDDSSTPVEKKDITLNITAPKDKTALNEAVESSGAFNGVDPANRRLLRIQLEDEDGNLVSMTGMMQVQLPYPAGTTANDTFTVVVNVDGKHTVITPDRTSGGLVLTLNAGTINQDLAIGWVPYTPPTPGGDTGSSGGNWGGGISYQEQQRRFWETVRAAIQKAAPGSTIRADAQSYDQMPAYVMRALYWANDITLVISWNGGVDLVIHSDSAVYPEDIRSYYPLSYLQGIYGVNMPVLGDDYEGEIAAGRSQVMDVRAPVIPEDVQVAFTPAEEGLLDVPVPVTVEPETEAVVPTIPEVTVAAVANNTNTLGYVCLSLAGLLVLAGGAVLILRRRKG